MRCKRNSNIECLRIISMMMIVIGHYVGQNSVETWNVSLNDVILFLLSSGSRIAVNVFLIIGVYFMLDTKFKAERITSIYGQTIFYTYSLTIVSLFFNESQISVKAFLRGIIPFWGRALWFVSAYITLMFFAPYLNQIIHSCNKKKLRILVILCILFVSFVSTLPNEQSGYLCDSIWFLIVYIIIGYLKKYKAFEKENKIILLLVGSGLYICLVMLSYATAVCNSNKFITIFGMLSRQYLADIRTIPNFAIALCVFLFFIKCKEKHNDIIIKLAKTAFPTYVFHQVPAFYPILWKYVYCGENWRGRHLFIWTIFVFITLFIIVSIIETFREKCLESLWRNSKLVNKVNSKLNDLYEN